MSPRPRRTTPAARARGLGAAIALAALAAACGARRTQLVVRVATDMAQGPGQLLTAVRAGVALAADGGAVDQFVRPLDGADGGAARLPGDFAVFVPDGVDTVTVRVTALNGGAELLTVARTIATPPGRVTFLDVFLPECAAQRPARPCPSRMMCIETGCVPDPSVVRLTTCGNGVLDPDETCNNCPEDVGPRDGTCAGNNNCGNCPEDCLTCAEACPMRHDCRTCADTRGCGWCGSAAACAPCSGFNTCTPIAPCDGGWAPNTTNCPP